MFPQISVCHVEAATLAFFILSLREAFASNARYVMSTVYILFCIYVIFVYIYVFGGRFYSNQLLFVHFCTCRRTSQRHCSDMMMMAISRTVLCVVLGWRLFSVEMLAAAGLNLHFWPYS